MHLVPTPCAFYCTNLQARAPCIPCHAGPLVYSVRFSAMASAAAATAEKSPAIFLTKHNTYNAFTEKEVTLSPVGEHDVKVQVRGSTGVLPGATVALRGLAARVHGAAACGMPGSLPAPAHHR